MADPQRRKVVAVLGGGISGLSAAWTLSQANGSSGSGVIRSRGSEGATAGFDIVLYERSGRLGGRIETIDLDGRPLDTGPDAFITRQPAAVDLCRRLGLGEELLSPSAGAAMLFARGAARPFPKGLVLGVPSDLRALARARVLSAAGLARVAADLVLPRSATDRAAAGDPTVAAVLAPRIGEEAVSTLVDPLVGGINAGSADRLSFRSVMPQVAAACDGQRSIVLALRRSARSAVPAPPVASQVAVFQGLAGGLGRMIGELERQLEVAGVRICRDTPVSELRRDRSGYSFRAGSGVAKADGVVVALPAPAAAALLGGVASAAVTDLGAVSYSGVALVALAWPSDAVPTDATWSSLVPGPQHGAAADRLSGVLVPRPQRDLVTACTFTSSKWPRSASPGRLLLRASVGSNDDDRHRSMDDSELVRRVTDDLRRIVGLGGKPTTVLVKRFDGSFPLYEQGHQARVARIRRHLAAAPGVAVAGAAFDGIGIPACIVSGRAAAETVAAALASTGGASTGGASRLAG